jgi:serine/threonine protein kinase
LIVVAHNDEQQLTTINEQRTSNYEPFASRHVTTDFDVNLEPLPGYRLIKHLGAGGYGEVWSAEAPGGLMKAIKFVFGREHEKRASHELRALDRVRSVRHPFLLSLERIEVVDGRLLVVSELADGSLKDRFDECRRHGQAGVPRDELIGYLRDAADALDFMIKTHALGHLDIKPENLLLLAGHVKVADFGLVKDVRQSQASLVGGMTPLYAAPEVFRGLPGPHSDQYSLAVLYQEMLTGTLPFAGSSAAELTLHHLNDEPDMSPLSDGDRYVISRALAKDPAHRYASCREFIDALAAVSSATFGGSGEGEPKHSIPRAIPQTTCSPSVPTDVFDVDETDANGVNSARLLIDLPTRPAQITDLPPLPLDSNAAQPAPALVIGIGGAAGRVLTHLRSMLREQFANPAGLPAIQLLLFDTDTRAVSEATRHDGVGLTAEETMALPLERPQHYRDQSQQLLRWLSRRWLYNIPRSLRTEGLRPLGRLALTDHARQVGQRIRRGITQAVNADAVASSSRALGRAVRSDAVEVFVVASISGGTGGGMSLDVGYAVRAILDKIGLASTSIIGIMLHATGGDARHCELARVNSFSWLTELQHFQLPNVSYPGDPSCGFPAHPSGVKPFDETYLVHLGDNLDAVDFDAATRCVAEYLRLNVVTPAKAFFHAHRDATAAGKGISSDAAAPNHLRSFGIFRHASSAAGACDALSHSVCQRVIELWQCGQTQAAAGNSAAVTAGMQLVRRLQLDADGIFANMRALIERHLGTDAESFLSTRLTQRSHPDLSRLAARPPAAAAAIAEIDRLFDRSAAETANDSGWLLGQSAESITEPLVEKLRAEMRRWFVSRLDDPCERLAGARRSLDWAINHLQTVDAALRNSDAALLAKLRAKTGGETATSQAAQAHPAVNPLEYFRLRLDQMSLRVAGYAIRLLLSDTKTNGDELIALRREIEQMAQTVAAGSDNDQALDTSQQEQWLAPRLDGLAAQVDQQLAAERLGDQGLWATIMGGGRRRAQLCAKLQEHSRQVTTHALCEFQAIDELTTDRDVDSAAQMRSHLCSATPALLEHGGTRRVLAVLPRHQANREAAAALSKAIGLNVNAMAGSDASLILCVEAAELPINEVAVELVQRRRDRVEFAGRVQCRSDIPWTPLVIETPAAAPSTWIDIEPGLENSNQVTAQTMVL